MVPKWKLLKIYWNLAKLIFEICRSGFWCQKWFFIIYLPIASPKMKNVQNFLKFGRSDISNLPPVRPKLAPKLNMLRIYWNLAYLIFQICRFWFKCQKLFMKYLPPVRFKLVPKLKMLRLYLLKIGTFDISNVPISILMSKIIFVKYLQPLRLKLFPKLKILRIYWNLARLIFQIYRCRF